MCTRKRVDGKWYRSGLCPGYQVTMRDIEQRFIDGGMNTIKKNLSRNVDKEKMTQDEGVKPLAKKLSF